MYSFVFVLENRVLQIFTQQSAVKTCVI